MRLKARILSDALDSDNGWDTDSILCLIETLCDIRDVLAGNIDNDLVKCSKCGEIKEVCCNSGWDLDQVDIEPVCGDCCDKNNHK